MAVRVDSQVQKPSWQGWAKSFFPTGWIEKGSKLTTLAKSYLSYLPLPKQKPAPQPLPKELPIGSRFLPQSLIEQIREKNRTYPRNGPLTLAVTSTENAAGGIVPACDFELLKQNETDRVAILEIPPGGSLKSTLKAFKENYGEPSTVFLIGHGLESQIFLGEETYSVDTAHPDDFEDTAANATIVFSSCLSGKKLVPALASLQPKESSRSFLAFRNSITSYASSFYICPVHGLEGSGFDEKLREVGRVFLHGEERMPCVSDLKHSIWKEKREHHCKKDPKITGTFHFYGIGTEPSYEQAINAFSDLLKTQQNSGTFDKTLYLYFKIAHCMLLASELPQNATYNQRRILYAKIIYDWFKDPCDLNSSEKEEEFRKCFKMHRDELGSLLEEGSAIDRTISPVAYKFHMSNCDPMDSLLDQLKTLPLRPKDFLSILLFQLGQWQEWDVNLDEAAYLYEKAGKYGLTEGYHALGLVQQRRGKRKEAIDAFALSRLPESQQQIKNYK